MRFPKLSELDRDQSTIYQGAPPDGTVLIMGPPGTGKSVIAFHRAQFLHSLGRNPRVMMYNKVLARFASNRGGVAAEVVTSTLHSWVFGWWRQVIGRNGAPPTVDAGRYNHDWAAMQQEAVSAIVSKDRSSRVNWGHLIVDEGQDFPPSMYGTLKVIMDVANALGASPKLAITALADENQRLHEHRNSSLNDIRKQLGLHESDRNVFSLKRNYRNSKEVALFARAFYAGVETGLPDLPKRSADKPTVSMIPCDTHKKFLTTCAMKIARYAQGRRTEEIGVIVMGNTERERMVNRLRAKLDGEGIVVQSYASDDPDSRAEDLEFDTPGHVTVLNYQSAKGLEFDAVFVIDPAKLLNGGSTELLTKMAMYVMCSRARSTLNLMLVDDKAAHKLLSWIPNPAYELESLS